MMYPKKKWSPKKDYDGITEASIQSAVDDYLKIRGIDYFRFPDGFFSWMKFNAPPHIQKWFFGLFGGRPDNICMIPIGDGLAVTLLLELKTNTGELHGKQKLHKDEWCICKSTDEAIKAIDIFIKVAKEVKDGLFGCDD